MTIYDCQLRHGPDSRIVGKTETVSGRAMTWTYAYDKEGRLTGAHLDGRTVCDINYDREGRRVSDYFPHLDTHYRNYAYSGMDNRLQQAGNNGYTHDENGFRSIWNSGGKYTLYEYAPDYRLMKAEKRETGEAFEFTHDKEGRRSAKYCNGESVEAYRWLDAGGDPDWYGYCLDDPVNGVDPDGLRLRVGSRKAKGLVGWLGGNHAYLYSSKEDEAVGMGASSGKPSFAKEEPYQDPTNVIENPNEVSERAVLDHMKDTMNDGVWFPGLNDCHEAIDDTCKKFGLKNPGAPGGRIGKIPSKNEAPDWRGR